MLNNVFSVIAIFAGLYFTTLWYEEHSNRNQLEEYGVEAISEPFTDYIEEQENGRTLGYRATVTYETRSGSTATCRGEIPEALMEQFKAGEKEPRVTVYYVPDNTSICTIEDEDYGSGGGFMLLASIIMIVGGGLYLFNSIGLSKDG